MMNRMLSKTMMSGTGKGAKLNRPSAGKTGTSQDFRDAWFVGYTSDYIAGVWVGNDAGKGMQGITGGGLPARIWRDVMLEAHRGLPVTALSGWVPPKPVDSFTRFWRNLTGG
jgi:penicillin-binding protein 1A